MMPESLDLLTQREAAHFLRMSEAWLVKKRCDGTDLPYLKMGGRVFYQKKALIEWVNTRKR